MKSIKDTLKTTEARITALKKELAEKEALLPGLRYAVKELNGHAIAHEQDDDKVEGRLRLGEDTRIVLELLSQKGSASFDVLSDKVGDKRKVREAIRNLSRRRLVTKDDNGAMVTAEGRTFMRQYAEKH